MACLECFEYTSQDPFARLIVTTSRGPQVIWTWITPIYHTLQQNEAGWEPSRVARPLTEMFGQAVTSTLQICFELAWTNQPLHKPRASGLRDAEVLNCIVCLSVYRLQFKCTLLESTSQ